MPRRNLYLSPELDALARALPDVNLSELLKRALLEISNCPHDRLVCACCGRPTSPAEVSLEQRERFYRDLMWELEELLHAGGTLEGAGRIAKTLALRHGLRNAGRPLPRLPRSKRGRLNKPINNPNYERQIG
jgi:hypothetical protein